MSVRETHVGPNEKPAVELTEKTDDENEVSFGDSGPVMPPILCSFLKILTLQLIITSRFSSENFSLDSTSY